MPMHRTFPAVILCVAGFHPSLVHAAGDGTFLAPQVLDGTPNCVWAAAADLNGDGVTDVASVHASGEIRLHFGDPVRPREFAPSVSLAAGTGNFFILAADLDQDGSPDLAVADPGSSTYTLRSLGDGRFEAPRAVTGSSNSRVVAVADFDGDGVPDLASLDDFRSFSVHRGLGGGLFEFRVRHETTNAHDMLLGDFDGDLRPDVLVKTKETGIFPFRSDGLGDFTPLPLVSNLTVRGPIAGADFDGDGKDDLMTNYAVGISRGDGSYAKTLDLDRPFAPVGAADLDGDALADALVASLERDVLEVHRGRGDGTFRPVERYRVGDELWSFFVEDLDRDGSPDLVACGFASLSVAWGRGADRGIGTPSVIAHSGTAQDLAVGDLDRDGSPDLCLARGGTHPLAIFDPAGGPSSGERREIPTTNTIARVELADLDSDGALDLLGIDATLQDAVVVLLGADGLPRAEAAYPVGDVSARPLAGLIDGDENPDFLVASAASNWISIFLGRGDGHFDEAPKVPTLSTPRAALLGDLDGDGVRDLAVAARGGLAVHFGRGGGEFEGAVSLTVSRIEFLAVAIGDFDGDAVADLAAGGPQGVHAWRGLGGRAFEGPRVLLADETSLSLRVDDLEGDGLPDLTSASNTGVTVLRSTGAFTFAKPQSYRVSLDIRGHRATDLDRDGALDLVAFGVDDSYLLFGNPSGGTPRFRRGDSDGGGTVNLTDAVYVLAWLFQSGDGPACLDSADANHDGAVNLSDPVRTLGYLFLGGPPPPAPGPETCGPGPAPSLGCASSPCGAEALGPRSRIVR